MNRRLVIMVKKATDSVEKKVQMTIDGLKVGMSIPDLHGTKIKVTKNLISQMRAFEKENPKSHAIWKDKITGTFLYFKYYEDNPAEKKEKKKVGRKPKEEIEVEEESVDDEEELEEVLEEIEEKTKLDEEIEAEVEDEENELLDAIEDYKVEYNVKTVNTNSQKFKRFLYKWKQEN